MRRCWKKFCWRLAGSDARTTLNGTRKEGRGHPVGGATCAAGRGVADAFATQGHLCPGAAEQPSGKLALR